MRAPARRDSRAQRGPRCGIAVSCQGARASERHPPEPGDPAAAAPTPKAHPLLGGRPPEHRDQEGAPPSPRGSASSDAVPAPTSQGRALKADVIAFVGEHASASVEGLYRTASGALGRMIAVCDSQAGAALLRETQERHPDLIVFGNETALGRMASWNRGLLVRERDVLLVDGVTPAE